MRKCIITVVGQDTVGIIARICTYLAGKHINILDISQTIVSGYFNMIVIADMTACTKPYEEVEEELKLLGESMGLVINTQREGIFTAMHRI